MAHRVGPLTGTTLVSTSLPVGLVRTMRPHQWLKNVLVFAAPAAAGELGDAGVLVDTLIAFVAFCLAASGTYLLNDALDVDADRRHPTKRNRPIAAGIVPLPLAVACGVLLLIAGLAVAAAANADLVVTVAAYVTLTATYTLWLKRQPVLDVVAVAAGFVLRAIAGATATGLPISEWFFIVASFGALLMVVGKREGEARALGADAGLVRATLGAYSPSFLLTLRTLAAGTVLVAYCMWAFDSAGAVDNNPDAALWFQLSIAPFAVAILRYVLIIDEGRGGEPDEVVLHDRPLLLAGVAWAIIYGYGIYVA